MTSDRSSSSSSLGGDFNGWFNKQRREEDGCRFKRVACSVRRLQAQEKRALVERSGCLTHFGWLARARGLLQSAPGAGLLRPMRVRCELCIGVTDMVLRRRQCKQQIAEHISRWHTRCLQCLRLLQACNCGGQMWVRADIWAHLAMKRGRCLT